MNVLMLLKISMLNLWWQTGGHSLQRKEYKKAGAASKMHLVEGFWELRGSLVHGVSFLLTPQIQMRNPFCVYVCRVEWGCLM